MCRAADEERAGSTKLISQEPVWSRNFWLWIGFSVALLAGLCWFGMRFIDPGVGRWARGLRSTHHDVQEFAKVFSDLAQAEKILIPAGLLVLIGWVLRKANLTRAMSLVFISVAGSGILVNLLKLFFARPRPKMLVDFNEYGFLWFQTGADYASFPSGHSAAAMSAATALAFLAPRWAWAFLALGGALAASRVVAGYHYPTDVVAGVWLGGATTLFICREWLRRNPATFPVPQPPFTRARKSRSGWNPTGS